MEWPPALARNSTVTGLGTVAVSTPALIVALAKARVRSRLTAKRERPSVRNRATMLRHTGSRIAVLAVLDGTRKARMTITRVMPSVIRLGDAPIRASVK